MAASSPVPMPAPDHLPIPDAWPVSETLSDWHLLPTTPDWATVWPSLRRLSG